MADKPLALIDTPQGYSTWLADLKVRIHKAQQKASLAVNRELVGLYWRLGEILSNVKQLKVGEPRS